MNIGIIMFMLALILLQLFLVIKTLKNKKMTIKFASLWIFLLIIMCLVIAFPQLLINIAKLIGFEAPSNMILILGFFFLFYISFLITTTISIQNEKIKNLIQEVSMMKDEEKFKVKK